MKFLVLVFLTQYVIFIGCYNAVPNHRSKREVSGTLDIVNNNEQTIHEEVKPDEELTEKPCPEKTKPSNIEMGTVFQVIPPKDVFHEDESVGKSLQLSSKLDLIRSTNRIITLFVLLVSGIIEFFPMFLQLYNYLFN